MPASNVGVAFNKLMQLTPVPWSIQDFLSRFAATRGRPLTAEARSLPPLVHAMLVVQVHQDIIFFDVFDSPERSELQILHEVAHLAMNHSLIMAMINPLITDGTDAAGSDDQMGTCPYPLRQQAEADRLAATLIAAVRSQPQYQSATELGRLTSTLL
jgi:hypothetical protein